MSRYIDAEALERDGWRMTRTVRIDEKTMELQYKEPTDFPPVDAEPVRHGRWNKYYRMLSGDTFVCNRCGSCFVVLQGADKMNVCPYCRARMDKE